MNIRTIALERVDSFLVMISIAFFIPLIFSHPQWLVGIIINALLFISALKFDFRKQLPFILIPSIGALLHNTLFGTFTLFLIYFIPFIWLGNAILVKTMNKSKLPYLYRIVLASCLKALFLFIVAYTYFNLGLAPKIFLTAMGSMQLITALAGGLLVYAGKNRFN